MLSAKGRPVPDFCVRECEPLFEWKGRDDPSRACTSDARIVAMAKNCRLCCYLGGCAVVVIASAAAADRAQQKQTLAPHELRNAVAPSPIIWPTQVTGSYMC